MSDIENILTTLCAFLGLIAIGEQIHKAGVASVFYAKHKRLPPHPAELERDHIQKTATIERETLVAENTRLRAALQKAESDLEDIWRKTLNRI
jgi:hypothetical protein